MTWAGINPVVVGILSFLLSEAQAYKYFCAIEMNAYGMDDNNGRESWIKINGEKVVTGVSRGVTLVELDPRTCQVSARNTWDTNSGPALVGRCPAFKMGQYIDGLDKNTVILGISADEPRRNLYGACGYINVNFHAQFRVEVGPGTALDGRGKFLFVAQKSTRDKSFQIVRGRGGSNAHAHVMIFQKDGHDDVIIRGRVDSKSDSFSKSESKAIKKKDKQVAKQQKKVAKQQKKQAKKQQAQQRKQQKKQGKNKDKKKDKKG